MPQFLWTREEIASTLEGIKPTRPWPSSTPVGQERRSWLPPRPGVETDSVRSLGADRVTDFTGEVEGQLGALVPGGVTVVFHPAGDPANLVLSRERTARRSRTRPYRS